MPKVPDQPTNRPAASADHEKSAGPITPGETAVSIEIADLREALTPFALIPDDPTKAEDTVLYTLNREGRQCTITCAQIRTARRLLGLL